MNEGDRAEAIYELRTQVALLAARSKQLGLLHDGEYETQYQEIEALALSIAALARVLWSDLRRLS